LIVVLVVEIKLKEVHIFQLEEFLGVWFIFLNRGRKLFVLKTAFFFFSIAEAVDMVVVWVVNQ
jgi:hypothetical protein